MKNRNKSNHQVGFSVSWTKPKPMTTQVSIYKRLSIAPKIMYNFDILRFGFFTTTMIYLLFYEKHTLKQIDICKAF